MRLPTYYISYYILSQPDNMLYIIVNRINFWLLQFFSKEKFSENNSIWNFLITLEITICQ
jgi:hypothetical protein